MTIFNGHQSAGILVLNQHGGIINKLYTTQSPGSFTERGVVLDTTFRAGEQRGPNIELALYGSNCEVTVTGDYEIDDKLFNGELIEEGHYNAVVVKQAAPGFSIVRLTSGIAEAMMEGDSHE